MTDREKATELIIKIALFMANVDEEFHDSESKIIKEWINQRAQTQAKDDGYKYIELSVSYGTVLTDSIELVKSGDLDIYELCSDLRSKNIEPAEISAFDLAVEIMTADTVIHHKEASLIHQLADLLNISDIDVMEIIDKAILKMSKIPKKIDVEGLLKIDPTVSNKNADKQFQKEIKKWNAATASVDTELGRKIAQKMYDLFSEANDKYA